MSQRYTFEEEFHDGPQPAPSYDAGYTGPQPVMDMGNRPGQKLTTSELPRADAASSDARMTLAVLSLVMILALFLMTLGIASTHPFSSPVLWLAVFFSLLFTGVALGINIAFNRRR